MKPVHRLHPGLFACALLAAPVVTAQVAPTPAGTADGIQADLVEYPAAYFGRYQPATALDMVRQVPGFLVDDGASLRGFGGAVGNVLINDKYPSAKLDSPSALLARIPANQVLKVELIRNQVRGIDMQGRPVLVNVVLKDDIPALVRWDVYSRFHSEGPVKPGIDLSVSDRWNNIDYNAGARIEREANGETGNDAVFDENLMLLEESTVERFSTGIDLTGTLNASALLGRTFTQFNTRWHLEDGSPYQVSIFTPVSAGIGGTTLPPLSTGRTTMSMSSLPAWDRVCHATSQRTLVPPMSDTVSLSAYLSARCEMR